MKKILGLVLSLTVIAAICAGVLAYVNKLTVEPIAKADKEKKERAVKAVMPVGVERIEKADFCFVGKDASGNVLGYAVEGVDSGGYGGDIVLMVGFKADRKTVVGYKKIKANETPGFGAELDSQAFSSQFKDRVAQSLKVKKDGGEIEAMTSATITSRAVCKAIEDACKRLDKLK